MCHYVSTASSWRVYGACTAFALSVIVSIALSQRLHGAATEPLRSRGAPAALALRPSAFAVRLQNDETAMPLRCEQTQQMRLGDSGVNRLGDTSAIVNPAG